MIGKLRIAAVFTLGIGCTLSSPAHAIDSTSLEIGTGNKTTLTRLGIQWMWKNQWWRSNGTHVGGYWDLSVAHWRGKRFQNIPGQIQHLNAVGLTPVFRFQNDTLKGLYFEAGIGAHLLSDLYDNGPRQLSTRFQFGDHLGIGYVFRNNVDVGLRFQHFSNASIKQPNDGVNFALIRASYPF